jgi:hypothetical protein
MPSMMRTGKAKKIAAAIFGEKPKKDTPGKKKPSKEKVPYGPPAGAGYNF